MKSDKLGHVKLNLMRTTEDVFEFKDGLDSLVEFSE